MSDATYLSEPRWGKQALEHPMLSRHSTSLWTPPIRRAYDSAKLHILQRRSFYIAEATGEGKTTLLKAMQEELQKDLGNIYVAYYSAPNKPAPSIRAFFKKFLYSLDHPLTTGETGDLRERVSKRIECNVRQTDYSIAILIVDEAQAVDSDDFGFIKDIQNDLECVGISTVVILCGESPELEDRLSLMQELLRRKACADRFGNYRVRLGGYDMAALKVLLRAIDTKVWPTGSGITWTRFFFRDAFDKGFRLENEAEKLWKCLGSEGLIRRAKAKDADATSGTVLSRRLFEIVGDFVVRGESAALTPDGVSETIWLDVISTASD